MSKPLHGLFICILLIFGSSVKSQNFGVRTSGVTARVKSVSEIIATEATLVRDADEEDKEENEAPIRPQNPNSPRVATYGAQQLTQGNSVTSVNLSVHSNFLASDISEGAGYRPPDCNGDISTVSQIMMAVNGRLKVYNVPSVTAAALTTTMATSATALTSPVINLDMDAFFKSVPLGVSLVTDPHVRFDKNSGRWFIVAQDKSHSSQNYITIAVSNSTTITAGSTFSIYYMLSNTGSSDPTNDWFDYPTLGVDKFALYIGGNILDGATHGTNKGSSLYLINKASLLSGTLSATIWQYGTGTGKSGSVGASTMVGMLTPQGVQNDDANATEGYFIATDWATYGSMIIKRVSNPGGVASLSADMQLTVPATNGPIDQPALGSPNKVSAFDDRLFAAMVMTNKITGTPSLWTAQNISVNNSGVGSNTVMGDRNGSRWYEIRNLTTTPALYQSGTLYDGSAKARGFFMPSIAMNGQGHALLASSTTAADRRIQVAIACRYYSDVLGTQQAYDTVTQVTSAYNPGTAGVYRWGDYSQTVVDPSDNMTFWTFQEYTDNSNTWGLRAVQVMAPPPAQSVTVSGNPSSFCGSAVAITLTGLATNNAGFFDAGANYNRLTVTCSGGIVVSNVSFVSATQVTCNISTDGIAAGTYTFTITNPDGQTVTASFTLSAPCTVPNTNYYNALNADIKDLTSWWSNTDGATGSHPADFVSNNQVFNIIHSGATCGSNIIVSGVSSKVILGDGTTPISFNISASYNFTGKIDVTNNATLSIANAVNPVLGALGASSTVSFSRAAAQTIPSASYGNLSILTAGGNATAAGDISVGATLSIAGGSTLDLSTFALTGGSISISGTGSLLTQNISASPIPSGTTWSTAVSYNSSSAQTVVDGSYNNLDLTGGNRTLSATNNISISGIFTAGAGTLTTTGNTLVFTGSNQNLPAATYNNVTVSLAGGNLSQSGDVTISGILNYTAGKLAIGSNTLTLGGTVSGMSVSNCLTGSAASNISITGSGALGTLYFDQTTDGTTNAVNNFTVNRITSGTVTLGNQIDLLNTYTPTAGVLSSGGNLVIRSTASATARVAPGAAGGGYITGNVSVERYIPANVNRAWRLLSIPVSTTNTINAAWQNGQSAGVSGPSGHGVFITGNNANITFDAQTAGNSMLTYSGVTNLYSGIANTGLSIDNPTGGYFLYVRGDRGCKPSNSTIASTTLKVSGTLKEGTSTAVTVPNGQFALVGNPFPSEIDLTAVTRGSKIPDTYYVWDPLLSGAGGLGAFQTLTRSGATYTVTPGAGSYGSQYKLIESGQAFFIHSTGSSSNTFSIPETAKTTGTSNILFNPSSIVEQLKSNLYLASTNTLLDGNLVQYDSTYSAAVDEDDAIKLPNFQANFGISRDGNLLVVERRPLIQNTDTVFFNLTGLSQQAYVLQLSSSNLNHPGLFGFLEDSYLPAIHTPMNLDGVTNYNFSITADPQSANPNRFRVIFNPLSTLALTFTTLKAYQQNSDIQVEWKTENESGLRSYELQRSADGLLFARIATMPARNISSANYSWPDTHPIQGENYYRVKSIDLNGVEKYSAIVKVNMGDAHPLISIYPNPLKGSVMNLELRSMPGGKYTVRIINNIGQVLSSSVISHVDGSSTETINVGLVAKGEYQVEVVKPDNSVFTSRLTVQ